MHTSVRVVQYGLGPIGLACAGTVLKKQSQGAVSLEGVIDIDPAKAGKNLGELLPQKASTNIVVCPDSREILEKIRPDVVLHTTSSFLDRVHNQLLECAEFGAHVISSTEELSFPYDRHPQISKTLDEAARSHGTVILGTGVNPGYAMDALALFATGVCTDVDSVHVERVVDAGRRRKPLQLKVGAGLTRTEFEERKKTGLFGHIGLRESLLLVASGLGWPLDRIEENLESIPADTDVDTPYLHVLKGRTAGIHHSIAGYHREKPVLTLDLKMYVGAPESFDRVQVTGTPSLDLIFHGGIFGDTATIATLINAIPSVMSAQPGLYTVNKLPIPCAFGTQPTLA